MRTEGRHLLVEYHGCDPAALDDVAVVEGLMRRAAEAANATIVGAVFHPFAPCGVSGVLVVLESHLSIHTWPEHGYAAVDFYTCGDADPFLASAVIEAGLSATRVDSVLVRRGMLGAPRSLSVGHERPMKRVSTARP